MLFNILVCFGLVILFLLPSLVVAVLKVRDALGWGIDVMRTLANALLAVWPIVPWREW